MPKFTKKPVTIEAMQFTDLSINQCLRFVNAFGGKAQVEECISRENPLGYPEMRIKTLEGVMTASDGDWIIKGVNGEFYPCKPDIFEKTYAPAVDGADTHIGRMEAEYKELTDKSTKLDSFIYQNPIFKGLDGVERSSMVNQLSAMKTYLFYLNDRLQRALGK